jgi:hypothetical protein
MPHHPSAPKFFNERPNLSISRLAPLVKRGQDRNQVLGELVDRWITPTHTSDVGEDVISQHVALGGFFLDEIAFKDENDGTPINLGEILELVESRLIASLGSTEFESRHDLMILLRRCRFDVCDCSHTTIRPQFVAYDCAFPDRTNFSSTAFGDGASFLASQFGQETCFQFSDFENNSSFRSTVFGPKATFLQASFGDQADFEHVTFRGSSSFDATEFGAHARFAFARIGPQASFRNAEFGDKCTFANAQIHKGVDFLAAHFGANADFSYCHLRENAAFVNARFGPDLNFRGIEFGKGANLSFCDFGPTARFTLARLGGADLRRTRGFAPDDTFVRHAHFSARPNDSWSILRRAYTGPRLIFNLLFLCVFFLPFVARTVAWVAAGKAQTEVVSRMEELEHTLASHRPSQPELVDLLTSSLRAIRSRMPGGAAETWRETAVWKLVLGIDKGLAIWISALLLLLYNIGRGAMTYIVAPMRDAEERSGYAPKRKAETWKRHRDEYHDEVFADEVARHNWKPPLIHRMRITQLWLAGYFDAYGWLIWPHRFLRVLFAFAVAAFLWNASHWLMTPVWVQQ